MAQNYVIAEFNGTTRKVSVPGDWNKSFPSLIKDIKQKFNLSSQLIDIEVFDRKSKSSFIIDKSEMPEVRKGSQVKVVVRGTGTGKGGAKNIKTNKNTTANGKPKPGSGRAGKQNGGKAPLVPPGAPPYSKADDAKRMAWKLGSRVEIYSEGQKRWQRGEIVKVFKDNEGEWLVIKYAGFRTKEIQRFSNYIRPVESAQTAKKTPTSTNSQKQSRDRRQNETRTATKSKKDAAQKPKSASAKKADQNSYVRVKPLKPQSQPQQQRKKLAVKKPSTADKYVRQRKARLQFSENEVFIAGNTKHIKPYVDRAYLLLKGEDQTPPTMAEEEATVHGGVDDDEKQVVVPVAAAASSEEEEEDGDEVLITMRDLRKKPSKVYGSIELIGEGRSMSAVVSTAEVVKRIVPGLFQETVLETIEFKDIYEPTEQGLNVVEISRFQTRLKITLATKEAAATALDQSAAGYQDPLTDQEFVSQVRYKTGKGNRAGNNKRATPGNTKK